MPRKDFPLGDLISTFQMSRWPHRMIKRHRCVTSVLAASIKQSYEKTRYSPCMGYFPVDLSLKSNSREMATGSVSREGVDANCTIRSSRCQGSFHKLCGKCRATFTSQYFLPLGANSTVMRIYMTPYQHGRIVEAKLCGPKQSPKQSPYIRFLLIGRKPCYLCASVLYWSGERTWHLFVRHNVKKQSLFYFPQQSSEHNATPSQNVFVLNLHLFSQRDSKETNSLGTNMRQRQEL